MERLFTRSPFATQHQLGVSDLTVAFRAGAGGHGGRKQSEQHTEQRLKAQARLQHANAEVDPRADLEAASATVVSEDPLLAGARGLVDNAAGFYGYFAGPEATIVTVMCDTGERYLSTWLWEEA